MPAPAAPSSEDVSSYFSGHRPSVAPGFRRSNISTVLPPPPPPPPFVRSQIFPSQPLSSRYASSCNGDIPETDMASFMDDNKSSIQTKTSLSHKKSFNGDGSGEGSRIWAAKKVESIHTAYTAGKPLLESSAMLLLSMLFTLFTFHLLVETFSSAPFKWHTK